MDCRLDEIISSDLISRPKSRALSTVKSSLAVGLASLMLLSGCDYNKSSSTLISPSPVTEHPSPALGCPGESMIGDLRQKPEIMIVGLKRGDYFINGTAKNLDPKQMHVVLWAFTDRWYVQPSTDNTNTPVCSDGSWQNTTHPWDKIVALLVDKNYLPMPVRDAHPSADSGVLAWAEYSAAEERAVAFSGFDWKVKSSNFPLGPGPNYFSMSPSSVYVDGEGLHLKTRQEEGKWRCAEVFLNSSLGYGEYTYTVARRVDNLDFNAVFSGFVYESLSREIDIEFSSYLANPHNMQFVVQPYFNPGNILKFNMPSTSLSTHRFEWRKDKIDFTSWTGDGEPNQGNLINEWRYTGQDIPPPGGERMRFNLWLFDGKAPAGGMGDEVVIGSFRYKQ